MKRSGPVPATEAVTDSARSSGGELGAVEAAREGSAMEGKGEED